MRFPLLPNRTAVQILLFGLLMVLGGFNHLQAATPQAAIQLYNQACAANMAGNRDQAIDLLQQAVAQGFEDLRFARRDPDLSGLSASDAFESLFVAQQSRLMLLSSEKGLNLRSEQWSPWQNLDSHDDIPAQRVRFQWQPLSLIFELEVRGPLAAAFQTTTAAPWSGGPGVMLTLAIDDETSAFESGNTFHFAFGKNKTSGIGALWLGSSIGWQPVHDLTPVIESPSKDKTILSGEISWQSLLPYHPLVDNPLGLNFSVRTAGSQPLAASLLPDAQAFSPRAGQHRYVPLSFEGASEERESLVGRLGHSLVSEDPLDLQLALHSFSEGPGWIEMDFLDDQGRSVLETGAIRGSHDFSLGVNHLDQQADFRQLNPGPYLIKIEAGLPSGNTLSWSSQVLNLGPDWQGLLEDNVAELKEKERPTGAFYLETIVQAAAQLPARRHPGSLTTTFLELSTFLAMNQMHGSLLPDAGVFLVARPLPHGGHQMVSLYLPKGFKETDQLEPVVLWIEDARLARRLAARMARSYEHNPHLAIEAMQNRNKFPVYIIPHPPVEGPVPNLSGCLNWSRDFFGAKTLAVAGMDAACGDVLQDLRLDRPDVTRLMIFAGSRLAPWPLEGEAELAKRFARSKPSTVPITWLDFFKETRASGQGKMLLSVIRNSQYNLEPVQDIRGGLNLTQVADRLILWAEGIEK